MRLLLFMLCMTSLVASSQTIEYSPGKVLSRTVNENHYDTDYLYIVNYSDTPLNLYFQLVGQPGLSGWHSSLCTNLICLNNVPKEGELGQLANGEQAYLALSLATNEVLGEGEFVFRIFDPEQPEMDDTVRFKYKIIDEQAILDQPWVRINFEENVITILLKNQHYSSNVMIYDLNGKLILNETVSGIYSTSLNRLQDGIYLAVVTDESGRKEVKKIFVSH